ncbi:MAG: helix-turn-helix transcriptional regulator [Nannocystaceae bacterium]
MDPEPNEETKVSVASSASRQSGASDDPSSSADSAVSEMSGDMSGMSEALGDTVDGRGGDSKPDTASSEPSTPAPARKQSTRSRPKAGTHPNNVRRLRQRAMMSKAELARRAGVSPLTIDRVESGCPCRMDTKRKILEALGIAVASAAEVFPDVDLG